MLNKIMENSGTGLSVVYLIKVGLYNKLSQNAHHCFRYITFLILVRDPVWSINESIIEHVTITSVFTEKKKFGAKKQNSLIWSFEL